MTRRRTEVPSQHLEILTRLMPGRPGPESIDVRAALCAEVRAGMPDLAPRLDHHLLGEIDRLYISMEELQEVQEELQELHKKLTSPPWFSAVYYGLQETPTGPVALVKFSGGYRGVQCLDTIDLSRLELGTYVYLNPEVNVIVGVVEEGLPPYGETATVDRYVDGKRFVVKSREAEYVIEGTKDLKGVTLKAGDQVRWDRENGLAFEKVEKPVGKQYFLEDTPKVQPQQFGGHRSLLDSLIAALTTSLVDPAKAAIYGLGGRKSILMYGPPGCGKTLAARIAAAEVARLSGRKCRFAVAKPSEWENPFVGVTQENIRHCFQALREAASDDDMAVLFLDEVESVGRIRGSGLNTHGDKFLAALLAELDGFVDRTGVAVIAATNRKDLLDPAILERLSDLEIEVPRPDMRGAKQIFDIHLPESTPFFPNGKLAGDTRREIIDIAVSRMYSPNADNELCTIHFQDGKTRTVAARDLASGRQIEQICRTARQLAFLRDVRGGEPGVMLEDMQDAVCQAITRLTTTLSPRNVHSYLSDLPQDVQVTKVEPIKRRVARAHRFVTA